MSADLSVPAALIAERMGLHFPKDRWSDLARGLAKTATSLGFENAQGFIAQLVAGSFGQREMQALANHLTVPETHFFRSPETFAMLQARLLPELIAASQNTTRRLRIWSAGCATGQEPFSLAILVSRLIAGLDAWDVTILASDINAEGFTTASSAEYTQWSFRGTPSWVVNGYFTKTRDGRYRLAPAIREMVTFRYLNLVEDVYPTDCDLILCRNVMMYFSRDTATRVAERLHGSIREGGYLLVTPSETSRDIQGRLASLTIDGEIVYKKTPAQPVATESPRPHASAVKGRGHSDRAVAPRSPHGAREGKSDRAPSTTPKSKRASGSSAQPQIQPQRGELRLERRAYARDERPAERPAEQTDSREAAREARLLADKGDLEQALARCEAALDGEKLNPSLYYLKASILQELDRPSEAEQALQSTLFLDGGFALARVMLGAIARSQSRSREAAKHFREALSLLEQMPSDSVLAETNGLTAGEMVETVASLIGSERVS
jgi:chemotaxis protein methyltransferase CheR